MNHVFSLLNANLLKSVKNRFPTINLCYREFSESHVIKSSHRLSMASFNKEVHEKEEATKTNKDEEITDDKNTNMCNAVTDGKTMGPTGGPNVTSTNPAFAGLSKRAQRKLQRKEIMKAKRKESRKHLLTKNNNPGFTSDYFGLTDYYYENGLRKVYPYYFHFESYVKKRWLGKSVFDVMREFQVDSEDQNKSMEETLKDGDITLNGEVITTDRMLKDGDLLSHRVHRHENPVIGTPLEVLVDDDDVIVINKPSSIPSHPCGRYRFNSIPFIIGKDLGYTNLRSIYRLDRLTSGLLILAKSAKKTREMEDDILQKRVQKEYLARVPGRFPDGVVECDQPLGVLSNKDSLYGVIPGGKDSKTVFEFISYNGKSSLIRCLPRTGRTHQIRLHLQYLGFPVKNDPMYNEVCFGPSNAKGGVLEKSIPDIVKSFRENHNSGAWVEGDNPLFQQRLDEEKTAKDIQNKQHPSCQMETSNQCEEVSNSNLCDKNASDANLCETEACDSNLCETEACDSNLCEREAAKYASHRTSFSGEGPTAKRLKISEKTDKRAEFDSKKWIPDAKCFHCKKSFKDPTPSHMIMYLHAFKYKGPRWEYETSLPDWAREGWIDPV